MWRRNQHRPGLSLYSGIRVQAWIQFEPRDLWIGLFWKRMLWSHIISPATKQEYDQITLYICLIPCFPIVIDLYSKVRIVPNKGTRVKG